MGGLKKIEFLTSPQMMLMPLTQGTTLWNHRIDGWRVIWFSLTLPIYSFILLIHLRFIKFSLKSCFYPVDWIFSGQEASLKLGTTFGGYGEHQSSWSLPHSPARQLYLFCFVLLCTCSTAAGLSVAMETDGWHGWGGRSGLGGKLLWDWNFPDCSGKHV